MPAPKGYLVDMGTLRVRPLPAVGVEREPIPPMERERGTRRTSTRKSQLREITHLGDGPINLSSFRAPLSNIYTTIALDLDNAHS
jgi:hypothetical protein